jgi:hypothetical protein
MRQSFLDPVLRQPSGAWTVRNSRNDRVLVSRIECAFDSASRRKGLLGRTSLDEDLGLIIAPSNSIHTFFMRFPIDLAFVTRDGGVISLSRAVPAWRIRIAPRAFAVIEMAAGTVARADMKVGDRVFLSQPG